MEKIILACLLLAFCMACDDGGPDCGISIFDLSDSECLAEDILRTCPRDGSLTCKATFSDGTVGVVIPNKSSRDRCMALDCETIECPDFIFMDLSIEDIVLSGTVIRVSDGEESELEDCGAVVP